MFVGRHLHQFDDVGRWEAQPLQCTSLSRRRDFIKLIVCNYTTSDDFRRLVLILVLPIDKLGSREIEC